MMVPIEDLLSELGSIMVQHKSCTETGAYVQVKKACLSIPVELKIKNNGQLFGSLPRGIWKTGFQIPHCRITVNYGEGKPK